MMGWGKSQAIWRALTTVNAPLPAHIDADTLLDCLNLSTTDRRWRPHVRAFFDEVRVDVMMDLVLEGSTRFETLAKAIQFWEVDEAYESVGWVREMSAGSSPSSD